MTQSGTRLCAAAAVKNFGWKQGATLVHVIDSSPRLDVGSPDHLAPLFRVVRDQLPKCSGWSREDRTTQFCEPFLHCGIRERRIDFAVEPDDDFGWRILRCTDAKPTAGLVSRHEIGHGWGIRQSLQARRTGHCECE